MESILTKNQVKKISKQIKKDGKEYRINIQIQYDDDCGNGHNSFHITSKDGGANHEEIGKYFPELKKYFKWHLMNSDGPLHYIANTVYHASNKDHWGKVKGEPFNFKSQIKFGDFPITLKLDTNFIKFLKEDKSDFDFEVLEMPHADGSQTYTPKYTFGGYADKWYQCPFYSESEALNFLKALHLYKISWVSTPQSIGEGKNHDLKAARSCAIWPDATLEQLQSEKALKERLPALIAEFKTVVEELGFIF